jgi:hypothetical protein
MLSFLPTGRHPSIEISLKVLSGSSATHEIFLKFLIAFSMLYYSGSFFSPQSFCRLYPVFGLLFLRMIMKNAIRKR